MFRGREVTHPERGTAILDRLAGELAELAVVEQHPTQEGRNMTMMMAPSKAVLAGRLDAPVAANGGADADASSGAASADGAAPAVAASEPPAADAANGAAPGPPAPAASVGARTGSGSSQGPPQPAPKGTAGPSASAALP